MNSNSAGNDACMHHNNTQLVHSPHDDRVALSSSSARTSFRRVFLYSKLRTENVSPRVGAHECGTFVDRPLAFMCVRVMELPSANFRLDRRRSSGPLSPVATVVSSLVSTLLNTVGRCRQQLAGSVHSTPTASSNAVRGDSSRRPLLKTPPSGPTNPPARAWRAPIALGKLAGAAANAGVGL